MASTQKNRFGVHVDEHPFSINYNAKQKNIKFDYVRNYIQSAARRKLSSLRDRNVLPDEKKASGSKSAVR